MDDGFVDGYAGRCRIAAIPFETRFPTHLFDNPLRFPVQFRSRYPWFQARDDGFQGFVSDDTRRSHPLNLTWRFYHYPFR